MAKEDREKIVAFLTSFGDILKGFDPHADERLGDKERETYLDELGGMLSDEAQRKGNKS